MSCRAPILFKFGERSMRIVGAFRLEPEFGYSEPANNRYNVLQEQVGSWLFKRWRTLEEEFVPSFAWIELATLGTCSWESQLIRRYQPWIDASKPQ